MAFPDDSIGDQWTDGEGLDAADLHNRIDVPLDALRAALPVIGIIRVQASGASILVPDSTDYDLAFYNSGITYERDPQNHLSYAGGVITTDINGLLSWSIAFSWGTQTGSPIPTHHRDVYLKRNGSAVAEGRMNVPYPSLTGTWPSMGHPANGYAVCLAGDGLSASMYQTSGSSITNPAAQFTVILQAL